MTSRRPPATPSTVRATVAPSTCGRPVGLPGLLPVAVRCAEAHDDDSDGDDLFAEEAAHVARAVASRRAEFATVRRCARAALAELGVPRTPLVPGPDRAPRWPPGVVGSMTHCAGYRAAAVAWAADVLSLGVDAEPHAPLPRGVLDLVGRPEDKSHLLELPEDGTCWDRVLFCAKEAVYKTWYPLARRHLDFDQATVRFETSGVFRAHLRVPGPRVSGQEEVQVLPGRWTIDRGLVLASVVLRAPEHAARTAGSAPD